jgi:nitrous-oxide reductase
MVKRLKYPALVALVALALGALLLAGSCGDDDGNGDGDGNGNGNGGLSAELQAIADARGFTPEDIGHALKQFVPPGEYDDYVMFASGGHSGQVLVIGMPSMRILKVIAAFTPEPWQGYGYGAEWGDLLLEQGNSEIPTATDLTWGDVHHPALSETAGDYDGRWLYVNDRANGRMAMIDLRDFRVKQVLDVPNIQTSHGGMFVTPDSEYAMISSKFPMVWPPGDYADVSEYEEKYRGASSWLKIDADTGFIDFEESFQIEIPPYVQDLGDAGKLVSEGWGFIGSFNTEMSIGADFENDAVIGEAMEAGASRNNFDFLHVINWRKAEEVIAAGDYEEMNGMKVIRMETAIEEGLLYLISEPKSPHGIDVDPSGRYLVVSGKLDPHVTIYDFLAVQDAIENEDFEGVDPFGIPILTFDSVVAGSVEVGLGPLHTQFDDKGHGYTSLFLEPAIGKFSLGDDVIPAGEEPFVLQDKISVHYNIGHLATAEGDTVSPDSNWMVALNKWSIDRFPPVGPLHPQNFQLIDIKDGLAMAETNPMDLVADMPIGVGEPHYAQIMKRDKLDSIALTVYPAGTDALTMEISPDAIIGGEERIERSGDTVEIWMSATRSHFVPDVVRVKEGDTVKIHVTNIEEVRDATHGFAIADYNIQASLEPGEVANFEFVADKAGAYNFYCTEFCSALHLEMAGWFLVEPASAVAAP